MVRFDSAGRAQTISSRRLQQPQSESILYTTPYVSLHSNPTFKSIFSFVFDNKNLTKDSNDTQMKPIKLFFLFPKFCYYYYY